MTSTQTIAYTGDNSMERLHTETTSTFVASAPVAGGFVTSQNDRSGIPGSFTRVFTATGITQTATDSLGTSRSLTPTSAPSAVPTPPTKR